jgi:hypothetical protein
MVHTRSMQADCSTTHDELLRRCHETIRLVNTEENFTKQKEYGKMMIRAHCKFVMYLRYARDHDKRQERLRLEKVLLDKLRFWKRCHSDLDNFCSEYLLLLG